VAIDVVVLAAGQGKRMKSDLPKVLHPLAGKPLLAHVLETVSRLPDAKITTVVGHDAVAIKSRFTADKLFWVAQNEQLGTAHAVAQAMPQLRIGNPVLVVYGDIPLISLATLKKLISLSAKGGIALLTAKLEDPDGYGRIVRSEDGAVTAIIEQKDANKRQLAIKEINTGILCLPGDKIKSWLGKIEANNAQKEYYLTDIIAIACAEGYKIKTSQPASVEEIVGVNTRGQLAKLERVYQARLASNLMATGVSFGDPARFDCRGELVCEEDVFIDINCVFSGSVRIRKGVHIGPNCVISDADIGEQATIKAHTVIEGSASKGPVVIGRGAQLGPFARIREGTRIADDVRIGNFVETKQADIGYGSKANHLSYLGDTHIGSGVNIGAGTITCNYDGANKHRTDVGDGAFIGSNVSLVAPVTIGENATVGAGSTITKTVPADNLSLARGKQRNVTGWKRPAKD
jgi:bifunctional UDP-N-acetylglucosamine pyrophosphorylase / glucosamine-1-phosphate N-acetyltransferase